VKLNIGCGRDIREGWINLDIRAGDNIDVIHNLDDLPLPFDDDVFDEVYTSHILEHVLRWENLLHDIHRVMKSGGILIIRVPYGLDPTAYHIRSFTEWSLDNFIVEVNQNGGYSLEDEEKLFKQIDRKIRRRLFGNHTWHLNRLLGSLNLKFRIPLLNSHWMPFGRKAEIRWELEVVK